MVEVIYPPRCAGCGHRGVWVCDECWPDLERFESPLCSRCGVPSSLACRCGELNDAIAMCRSAARYGGWLRDGIRRLKYEGEPARSASLASLLFNAAVDFPDVDALVPAPLHRSRQKRRGYNQAELLAAPVAERLDRPLAHCLARTRPTRQQVGLDADTRRINVAGAFSVLEASAVADRRFLLVDDVITTGSTLNACADALRTAGAAWIGVLTLARDC